MKTKTITLMLLALVIAAGAFATEISKMSMVALNDSKVYVAAETSTNSPTEITLLDARGETIYFKRTKAAPQFRSVLNLQELSDGTYTFSLKSGKAVTKREITVSNGKVTVKKVAEEFAPYFAYKNGKVLLSYLNSNQADVSVLIYNGNRLVLDSSLGSDLAIQRSFDVSKLKNNEFEFVLYGNNHRYNYRFTR
ncbi:hypothetical protein [Maribellus sediminis]|uniref:hypothetical protein n=1 Tax=Maribellus sediminis TaxID=2696285 RepID=UPI00143136DD|nr:hypothetical protein [Maribellus sediminis]